MYTASATEKRQALLDLIEATLNAHLADGTSFRMEQRIRKAALLGSSQAERLSVMGSEDAGGIKRIRYCRVQKTGTPTTDDISIAGEVFEGAHTFRVMVFFGYEDADVYANSSQAAWDTMIDGEGDPAGLLYTLRQAGTIDAGADTCELGQPYDDDDDVLSMGSADALVHYLEFMITIT